MPPAASTPSRRASTRTANSTRSATPSRTRKSTEEPVVERPVTRSSSRKAARETSPVEDSPKKATRSRAARPSPSRTRARTPTRKAAASPSPKKAAPSPKKAAPKTPTRSTSRSRSRAAAKDEEDSDVEIVKAPKTKPSPRGRSRKVQDDDDDEEEEAVKPVAKPATEVRRRSRSRGRDSVAPDLLSSTASTTAASRRVASPSRRRAAAAAVSPLEQESEEDDEEEDDLAPIQRRTSTARRSRDSVTEQDLRRDLQEYSLERQALDTIQDRKPFDLFTTKDIVFIIFSALITLVATGVTLWFTNQDLRDAGHQFCPEMSALFSKYNPSSLELTLFNIVIYFISLFVLSYKLRRHDNASFHVISMLFRAFGSVNGLLAYLSFLPHQARSFNHIVHAAAPLLLAYSVVELVYSATFAGVPRFIDLFTSIGVTSYVLFFADPKNSIVAVLPQYLAPVLVVHFAHNAFLFFGYVGVLCFPTDRSTALSLSHSIVWIAILLTLVGPCFIFYIEVYQQIHEITTDKAQLTSAFSCVLLSVILSLANYADSMKISYLLQKDHADDVTDHNDEQHARKVAA